MIEEAELTEALRLVPVEILTLVRSASSVDAIRVGIRLDAFYGMVVSERLRFRERLVGNEIGQLTLSDAFRLVDALYNAYAAEVIETVSIEQFQALQATILLLEKLRVRETLIGNGRYQMSLAQGLKLVDSLARFYGIDIAEDLGLDDDMRARVLAIAGITETVGIEAVLKPQLHLHVVVDEGIALDPTEAVRMLFNPTVREGVSIEAGYLAPNGTFTTWVMNTRTAAVTEYDDFEFNSFARMGNRYFGAAADGLYELAGDDDDGDAIIARVKGGYLQFGGTQLSRLKEAYIAATGEGEMILKVRTKDGNEYIYSVDTRDGRSTRFHMGKGQRSRYFAFELISVGQDFDLDTLEFVPIVVQRRV